MASRERGASSPSGGSTTSPTRHSAKSILSRTFYAIRQQATVALARPPEAFEQVLVTEYAPGAGIGWHKDKPVFGKIVGISLAAACILRLRRRLTGKWQRISSELAPRVRDDRAVAAHKAANRHRCHGSVRPGQNAAPAQRSCRSKARNRQGRKPSAWFLQQLPTTARAWPALPAADRCCDCRAPPTR